MKPNFDNYTISELHDSLSKIDKEKYPENLAEIHRQIKHKQQVGFVLSGETSDTTTNQHDLSLIKVALPIWWRFTWRYGVATTLLSIILAIPLFLGFTFFGYQELLPFVIGVIQIIFIPIAGMFFIRQAIVGKYKNFYLEITPKANKTLKSDAKSSAL